MGVALYRVFQDAGLPAPTMRMEVPLGENASMADWLCDFLQSMKPLIEKHDLFPASLGNFDTLRERLRAEAVGSKSALAWNGMVGAWTICP